MTYPKLPFSFAVTQTVEKLCPFSLKEKDSEKIIESSAFLPTKGNSTDAGYDLRCAEPDGMELFPGKYFLMKLGIRMYAPLGWWLFLLPRSGTFAKKHIHSLYGVIDEQYENELCFAGVWNPDLSVPLAANHNLKIEFGERIAQVMPMPRLGFDPDSLSKTNEELDKIFSIRNGMRGTGGFNSSGSF